MYVLPAIPTVGAIFEDAALRKPCVTDTVWKVYVAELHFVVQFLSCVQLCNPVNCSTPGLPVLHHLPELAQIHVR